jgi:hypothetical protein
MPYILLMFLGFLLMGAALIRFRGSKQPG